MIDLKTGFDFNFDFAEIFQIGKAVFLLSPIEDENEDVQLVEFYKLENLDSA